MRWHGWFAWFCKAATRCCGEGKEERTVWCGVVLWECGGVKSEEGGGTTGIRSRALYKVVDVI